MLDLNGGWRLTYLPESGEQPQGPADLSTGRWPTIPAEVPGNVELDLVAAGLEPDPFFGDNLYRFRKYEFYGWWYTREFELPAEMVGKRLQLTLEGVNTYAEVFLNGRPVGQCDNMLIAHGFDATSVVVPGANELAVHIRSAANVARALEYPAGVSGGASI